LTGTVVFEPILWIRIELWNRKKDVPEVERH